MIEILNVRDLRYASIEEVPIKKEDVIKDVKYYKVLSTYDLIRKMLSEKTKRVYGERHTRDIWNQISSLYDQNFLDHFILIWKGKVFEKAAGISEEIDEKKEREIIEECFEDKSIRKELEEYFSSEFWKGTHLPELCEEKSEV